MLTASPASIHFSWSDDGNYQEEEEDRSEKFDCRILCLFPLLYVTICCIIGIRNFTQVSESDYFLPCNNTKLITSSEIEALISEANVYEKVIYEYDQSSILRNSKEARKIKMKKKEIEKEIKAQKCYQQKCAKINIENNLEDIKEKILTISMWLFRISALILSLSGILCYFKRQYLSWSFGNFVFLIVVPIFVNGFLSLYDYFSVINFKVEC